MTKTRNDVILKAMNLINVSDFNEALDAGAEVACNDAINSLLEEGRTAATPFVWWDSTLDDAIPEAAFNMLAKALQGDIAGLFYVDDSSYVASAERAKAALFTINPNSFVTTKYNTF